MPQHDTRTSDDDPALMDSGRLALRPREAAVALGISPRLLWSLTNQHKIPFLKLSTRTVYPVDLLRQWLAEQAAMEQRR